MKKSTCFLILSAIVCSSFGEIKEDKNYWYRLGESELKESLEQPRNLNKAKNVIIFIGDGMSPDTITASRIHSKGETGYLAWEKFPHIGLLKTYNIDKQAPDSASTATALFCGVKTNYNVLGVDGNVLLGDCEASLLANNRVDSIVDWAQSAGKSTGFVTTTRVTHATPAPLYAHTANRKWEGAVPNGVTACKDIARQLIEDEPGKNLRVIMGGGRQMMYRDVTATEEDPIDTWSGRREDSLNLIDAWKTDKISRNVSFSVAQNTDQLMKVNAKDTDFLLGIFANGHMSMDYKRNRGPTGMPSLKEMTISALNILKKNENGYLLMVEGGLIDVAHHRGHAAQALNETLGLSDAIEAALKMVDLKNTLVIVTSDHTHSMVFNGNSARGSNILGVIPNLYGIPYTTLSYSTGGKNALAYYATNDTKTPVERVNPLLNDTTDFMYSQQAAMITDEGHHGGGDVAAYAVGPYAHLFYTTHEQSYVANVIAYSLKIGPYHGTSNSTTRPYSEWNYVIQACLLFSVLFYSFWNAPLNQFPYSVVK